MKKVLISIGAIINILLIITTILIYLINHFNADVFGLYIANFLIIVAVALTLYQAFSKLNSEMKQQETIDTTPVIVFKYGSIIFIKLLVAYIIAVYVALLFGEGFFYGINFFSVGLGITNIIEYYFQVIRRKKWLKK